MTRALGVCVLAGLVSCGGRARVPGGHGGGLDGGLDAAAVVPDDGGAIPTGACTVPPVTQDLTLTHDLTVHTVTGRLTLEGAPFPPSSLLYATILFEDPATGARGGAVVDDALHAATYSARLFPGVYNVTVTPSVGSPTQAALVDPMPRVATGVIIRGDRTLDLDIRTHTVSGTLTLDGAALPDSALASRGSIRFRERVTRRELSAALSGTGPGSYVIRLPPGTYQVTLMTPGGTTGGALPPDTHTLIANDVVVSGDRTLEHDLRIVTVTGAITLGGARLPDNPAITSRGFVQFTDRTTGDTTAADVGPNWTGSYTARLFAGSYDVGFRTPATGGAPALPPASRTRIATDVAMSGDRTLDYDLRVHTVTGRLTLRGADLPDSPGLDTRGRLWFIDRSSGDFSVVAFGGTGPVSYSLRLFAGSYDVQLDTPRSELLQALPSAAVTRLAHALVIGGDRTLDHDLDVHTVTGTLTLGGAELPASAAGVTRGTVTFKDRATSSAATATVGPTGPARYSVLVFPGSYDLTFDTPTSLAMTPDLPGQLPSSARALVATGVAVSGDRTLDHDLVLHTVTGTFTVKGNAVPDSPGLNSRGMVAFKGLTGVFGAKADIAATGPAGYSIRLFPGSYDLSFFTPESAAAATMLQALPPGAATRVARGCLPLQPACRSDAANITGAWTLFSDDWQGGYPADVVQEGNSVTLSYATSPGIHTYVWGARSGNALELAGDKLSSASCLLSDTRATIVDGCTISGEFTCGSSGSRAFTAVRQAL